MFISINRASFEGWWKENLVKHQKVSEYYQNDWNWRYYQLGIAFTQCFWQRLFPSWYSSDWHSDLRHSVNLSCCRFWAFCVRSIQQEEFACLTRFTSCHRDLRRALVISHVPVRCSTSFTNKLEHVTNFSYLDSFHRLDLSLSKEASAKSAVTPVPLILPCC